MAKIVLELKIHRTLQRSDLNKVTNLETNESDIFQFWNQLVQFCFKIIKYIKLDNLYDAFFSNIYLLFVIIIKGKLVFGAGSISW